MRIRPQHFEGDDAKAAANLDKHGVPFPVALAVFADPNVKVVDSARPQDRESREQAIGMIMDRLFTAVLVMRGEVCRLISARRANAGEERAYGMCDT